MTVKPGDKIPDAQLMHLSDAGPAPITTDELFAGKTVAMFALPGAFTPTCSNQHLPGFIEKSEELRAAGVDTIICLSVNDAFVMNAWFKDTNVKKVKAIGDGEGVFTQGMGMLVNKPGQGFGMRSWRYSMLVDNGEVVKVFEEPGKNNASEDNDPFEVSDVDTMLQYLKNNAG